VCCLCVACVLLMCCLCVANVLRFGKRTVTSASRSKKIKKCRQDWPAARVFLMCS